MQFEKDLESEFKHLFLQAREILLSYEGIIETKKDRIGPCETLEKEIEI